MLGPALQRLFVEIDQVDASARSEFEADLHRELTAVSSTFDWLRQSKVKKLAVKSPGDAALTSALSAAKNLLRLDVGVSRGDSDSKSVDVGTGKYPISISTRCSKSDCPNKRIK